MKIDETSRKIKELERELAAAKNHMKVSGVTPPKVVRGFYEYSGKEEEFQKKTYAFRVGSTRIRFRGTTGLELSQAERELLFDKDGLLILSKAIESKKIMNHLIERKSGIVEEIVEEETTTEPEA